MKVLVTGHRGYIGAEMAPAIRDAGHEVVGLDIGLYDDCDFVIPPDDFPTVDVDLRDITAADLEGFDAVVHLGALSNDPLGDLNAQLTYDINLDASVRLAQAAKDAGVAALPVRLVVQPVRRRRRRPPRRDGRLLPADRVRRVEGPRRAGRQRARRRWLLARVPPQRHRLRRVAPAARRHRRQQPRRLRRHHRRGPADERRLAMAPARAHPRHHRRLHRLPRCAARGDPQRGLQRRHERRELPHPRRRRDRQGRRARLRGDVRRRRLPRHPQLPGRLHQDHREGARASDRRGRCGPASRSCTGPTPRPS